MRRLLFVAVLLAALPLPIVGQELRLPNKPGSVKFAVIGDTGTGGSEQKSIANELASWHTRYPFEFVVMMGDNLYGGESPKTSTRSSRSPTSRSSTRESSSTPRLAITTTPPCSAITSRSI